MLDLVIEGGTVVDGTGSPGRRVDVGIEGDSVAEIGDLGSVAAERIDASGMVVAPGFVDIHSHSDFTLLIDGRAQSQIFQGVTTELLGNCGHGCAPLTDPARFTANIYGYQPLVDMDWQTIDGYLTRLEEAKPAVNVATLVPNGNLRISAVDDPARPATSGELSKMVRLLSDGMEMGAFGFSTGLEYPWERAASESEVIELCNVVAAAGGLYATHERDKDRHAVAAVEEAVRVSAETGVRLQVSHIIPRRGAPPGALEQVISLVEEAHGRGLHAQFDAHTRTHGVLNLSAVLPPWALEGGAAALGARLSDPEATADMKRYESIVSVKQHAGWDRVFLFSSEASPHKVGKSLDELTPDDGDVFDAMYQILLDEGDALHQPMIIVESYDEDMLRRSFTHPLCTAGSDATALCLDGPLRDASFLGAYTWAGWYFHRMVAEWGDLTVEEAVHRLTGQPAEHIGLSRRGRLARGFKADVVVFDAAQFRERGTLSEPNQAAEGMEHVFVNGGHTLRNGTPSGNRTGEVLRST